MNSRFGAIGEIWAMLVAGWADHLDSSGARLVIDGIHNDADRNGSYEGVTRMFWGIGGWLSYPERSETITWQGREYDLEQLMRRALVTGTDPRQRGYWGDLVSTGALQPTVESAQVGYALWQTRSRVWDRLPVDEQQLIADWLIACGQPRHDRWRSNWPRLQAFRLAEWLRLNLRSGSDRRRRVRWHNNWALFWALNHASRQALGLPFDSEVIDDVTGRYLDDVYCGDGWYDDGPSRGTNYFDDYNLWVFAAHTLMWIDVDGSRHTDRAYELLERVRALMEHVPYFFAKDGAYPEYGRSGSYKFGRIGALLWAYRHGVWPHSPGLLRTIVERHLTWYLERGAVRANGTLRQSLTANGTDAIRESYISTGAPYWAMQLFGGLWSLPDEDPFWSTPAEPLPIEKSDVRKVFPQPGWIITGTQESGHIHRFTTHVCHYPAKYDKHVYSTAAPYNAVLTRGVPTPDAMIGLHLDGRVSRRTKNDSASIGGDGWIRYRHRHQVAKFQVLFDTVIVPDGDLHLRLHRVIETSNGEPVPVLERAAALGYYDEEPFLICGHEHSISGGMTSDHAVAIRAWDDLRVPGGPRAFADGGKGNVVHTWNVIPHLYGEMAPGNVAISTVFLGASAQVPDSAFAARLKDEPSVRWLENGSVEIYWRGRQLSIPAN